MVTTLTRKDCVVVACANFLNKPYAEVVKGLSRATRRTGMPQGMKINNPHSGYHNVVTREFLEQEANLNECRNGELPFNGIIRVTPSKDDNVVGHVMMVREGVVYDFDGEVIPDLTQHPTYANQVIERAWK